MHCWKAYLTALLMAALAGGCARGITPRDARAGETWVPSDDGGEDDADASDATEGDEGDDTGEASDGDEDGGDGNDVPRESSDLPPDTHGDSPGAACVESTDCASGFCVDHVCCESACNAACKTCNQAGNAGKCVNVRWGLEDPDALTPCLKPVTACDGFGNCRRTNDQPCVTGDDCLSYACASGICCVTSSCNGPCKSCGTAGACTNLPAGPSANCQGGAVCDGAGVCKKPVGFACSGTVDCTSGFCVDGVCCSTDCTTTCYACNVSGKLGTCSFLPNSSNDSYPAGACSAPLACNGKGTCGRIDGTDCFQDSDCLSGLCCGAPDKAKLCHTASLGCWCFNKDYCRPDAPFCCHLPAETNDTCRKDPAGCGCFDATTCGGTTPACCAVSGGAKTCRANTAGCDCFNASGCGAGTPLCCSNICKAAC